jgi:hypothetical protein
MMTFHMIFQDFNVQRYVPTHHTSYGPVHSYHTRSTPPLELPRPNLLFAFTCNFRIPLRPLIGPKSPIDSGVQGSAQGFSGTLNKHH